MNIFNFNSFVFRLPHGRHGRPRDGRPHGSNDGWRLPPRHEPVPQNGRRTHGRRHGSHGRRDAGAPHGRPWENATIQRSERPGESQRAQHDTVPTDACADAMQRRPPRPAESRLPAASHEPHADGGGQGRPLLPPARHGHGGGHAGRHAGSCGDAENAAPLPGRIQQPAQDVGVPRPTAADVRAAVPGGEGWHGPRRADGVGPAPAAVDGRAGRRVQGPGLPRAFHGGPHVRGAVPQLPTTVVRDGQPRGTAAPPLPRIRA